MSDRKIVIIGAAGVMVRPTIRQLVKSLTGYKIVLCDIALEPLQDFTKELPPDTVEIAKVDLYDGKILRETIKGSSLVLLVAGPFMATAEPVIDACIDLKIDYLDIDDDLESTEHSLSMHEKAKQAGVAMYIGCGASPGMTNILALDAAMQLDKVEDLDVVWCFGDEGPVPYGRAAVEHGIHIGINCHTIKDGRVITEESFIESEIFSFGYELGDYRMYRVGHPETMTLFRRFPEALNIKCFGGLHPQPVNGIWKGLSKGVQNSKITMEKAIDHFMDISVDRFGSWAGWKVCLKGMWQQVKNNEESFGNFRSFLFKALMGKHVPFKGGLVCRAAGIKDGKRISVTKRTSLSGSQYFYSDMANVTGLSCAACTVLALENRNGNKGVLSPEDWVSPQDFYKTLESFGIPQTEIVDSEYIIESKK